MRIILLFICLSLAGCSTITQTGTLPPETTNTLNFTLDTYCSQLVNVRRLLLRFIRAVDPQWTSVCETRERLALERELDLERNLEDGTN